MPKAKGGAENSKMLWKILFKCLTMASRISKKANETRRGLLSERIQRIEITFSHDDGEVLV